MTLLKYAKLKLRLKYRSTNNWMFSWWAGLKLKQCLEFDPMIESDKKLKEKLYCNRFSAHESLQNFTVSE